MDLHSHIETILWSEEQISKRVSDLAAQISRDFCGISPPPVVVGVATGAFLFLADLVRRIDLPIAVDFVRAESYGSGTESNGAPTISFDVKLDINGRHVILVEDIVDTGHTLSRLIAHLKSKGVSSVSVCTFLDKPSRRKVHFQLVGEGKFYRGFECPDFFVVGYGMDFAELYRNLPYIGVLKPEHYKEQVQQSEMGNIQNGMDASVVPQALAGSTMPMSFDGSASPTNITIQCPGTLSTTLASALASATPANQRIMLGELLLPLVKHLAPDHSAKVTGMLLEMDNSMVIHLIESPEALKLKVSEAMQVLHEAASSLHC